MTSDAYLTKEHLAGFDNYKVRTLRVAPSRYIIGVSWGRREEVAFVGLFSPYERIRSNQLVACIVNVLVVGPQSESGIL